jgi:hypothetical protein
MNTSSNGTLSGNSLALFNFGRVLNPPRVADVDAFDIVYVRIVARVLNVPANQNNTVLRLNSTLNTDGSRFVSNSSLLIVQPLLSTTIIANFNRSSTGTNITFVVQTTHTRPGSASVAFEPYLNLTLSAASSSAKQFTILPASISFDAGSVGTPDRQSVVTSTPPTNSAIFFAYDSVFPIAGLIKFSFVANTSRDVVFDDILLANYNITYATVWRNQLQSRVLNSAVSLVVTDVC